MFGKKRDGIWFAEQVQEMKSAMFYIAISILHSEWDAEDATANAILKAYENLDSLREPEKFRPWLLRILKNECCEYAKKNAKYVPQDKWELTEEFKPPNTDLWNAMKELGEKDRLAILLFYLEGYKIREIAEVLEEPVGTVKSRLSRTRKTLKELLK
ncbi:MAG: sigma-70 family RNA polymerase sigma factor [Lachnospiraceae bacterium]|nr:sigma-70 family RNA polymerase sigma factor [Lachnospiraceae bacterium]